LVAFLARQFARPAGLAGRWIVGPWLDRISGPMNRLALDEMRLQGREDVLEVGFGGGGLLKMLLRSTSGQVVGADISKAMLVRARRRFRAEKRLRLIEASADNLDLPEASIDKACSVNSLYFWPDPEAAVRELARVVRPGGTLTLCFEPPAELRKWPGHAYGLRLVEETELRGWMASAGFGRFRLAQGYGRKPDHFLCLTGERLAAEAAA
jgi:SAM-dependent methyltransferase